jgi:hypothetical protein
VQRPPSEAGALIIQISCSVPKLAEETTSAALRGRSVRGNLRHLPAALWHVTDVYNLIHGVDGFLLAGMAPQYKHFRYQVIFHIILIMVLVRGVFLLRHQRWHAYGLAATAAVHSPLMFNNYID